MKSAQLKYSLLCDDVRIEAGNKFSLMGVFQNIILPGFPYSIVKFAVLNHWEGQGEFETQVRILNPDHEELVSSLQSKFVIPPQGQADNITFFANVTFRKVIAPGELHSGKN